MDQKTETGETAAHLIALATWLEGDGQYNIAKLLRTAAEALLRRSAYQLTMPEDTAQMAGEIMRLVARLSYLSVDPHLVSAIQRGATAMAEGRLPLIHETPNPYVCRTCGRIELIKPALACPICDAHPETFISFLPVYWLEVFNPFQVMENLRCTPSDLGGYIQGIEEKTLLLKPPDGGWSVLQTLSHLRDAQSLLDFRLKLMIDQDNPVLEPQAVFEWAANEDSYSASTLDIFRDYDSSRQLTLDRLDALPFTHWWRTGQHQEFGVVTVLQQASYFAAHELTHLPQIARLIRKFQTS